MGRFIDCDEYKRWIAQGNHTFSLIDTDIQNGGFEWACFKSQQCAEMAVNAVLKSVGRDAFGHGLLKLYESCENLFGSNRLIKNAVSYLDKLYISPRYPDAFTEGSPWEHFTAGDAELARNSAEQILHWAQGVVNCL